MSRAVLDRARLGRRPGRSVDLGGRVIALHHDPAQDEQSDQVEQLEPDQPGGLLPSFAKICDRECDKQERIPELEWRMPMLQIATQDKQTEHQPSAPFKEIEP